MSQQSAVATQRQLKKATNEQLIVATDELEKFMNIVLEQVAQRAYEIFERRGNVHGHDWDDWYQAESELLQPVHVEQSDSGDAFIVVADVAGYPAESLRVSAEPRRLKICGHNRAGYAQSATLDERFPGFCQGLISLDTDSESFLCD
jgi:HSP20 family molecular chaperone IbpA